MTSEDYILLISLLGVFICGISIGYIYEHYELSEAIGMFKEKKINESSLADTSELLRDELMVFYNYNLTNIDKKLNQSELEEEGGVCWHYAQWYKKQLLDRSFYAILVDVNINETMKHEFTIASNKNEICLLDQMMVYCW